MTVISTCLLLLYFCVCAFAAPVNSVTGTFYSLVKPNTKNFVYNDRDTPLSVTVEIASYAQDEPLSLSFFTAENVAMAVSPTSSCVDANQNEIFTLTQGIIIAKSDITASTTCTYSATIRAGTPNLVFNRLSLLSIDTLPEVTPLTTSSPSFQGSWSLRLPRVGDMNVLTIDSAVVFAQGDTFVITANNGSPFASATACTNSAGTPLFTVAAQGSRLLFSARSALTSSFRCTTTIVVAASGVTNRKFVFSAPAHGLSSNSVGYFISFLDSATNFIRIGTYGTTIPPTVPNRSDNTLYLAIPASAVRAGDTIKLHASGWAGGDINSCKYRSGALAGSLKRAWEDHQYLGYTAYNAAMTLASPLEVNAQNYVELFCPITIFTPTDYGIYINAISMPRGVFAATWFQPTWSSLSSYSILDDGAYARVESYNEGLTSFNLRVENWYGAQGFVEADITLRGVTFTDLADVVSKCTFFKSNTKLLEPVGVSVVAGQMRVQLDTKTVIANDYSLTIECVFPAVAGTYVSVYDNMTQREITKELVHAGTSLVSFGDGIQTHWMASDAVAGEYKIPFQINFQNFYSDNLQQRTVLPRLRLRSSIHSIAPPNGQDSYALTCSTGSATGDRLETQKYANGAYYFASELLFSLVDGYDAVCTGTAVLNAYAASEESLNYITVDMTR